MKSDLGAFQTGGWLAVAAVTLSLFLPGHVQAQGGVAQSQATGGVAQSRIAAKIAAPIDLTGYWVAVITQDWRWRMVTPAKGDYAGVPITAEAKRVADTWDPAKDESSGAICKSYGAPG